MQYVVCIKKSNLPKREFNNIVVVNQLDIFVINTTDSARKIWLMQELLLFI